MRFYKNVPQENRELLTEQLKKYEKEMVMTSEERRELRKWVAKGRSPYDNGDYIYGENGWPMDFVSAMRFVEEETEWFRNLPDDEKEKYLRELRGEYDAQSDDIIIHVPRYDPATDSDAELPFQ